MTTTPTAANDNNPQRPAEFDRLLVKYMPGMYSHAKIFVRKHEIEELVQDTLAYALEKWRNYREAEGTFATWLQWQMRAVVQIRRSRYETRKKYTSNADAEKVMAVRSEPARQDELVYAGQVIGRLKRSRGGRMLLRRAKGEMLAEIGAKRKISQERVRQLIAKE
ncbi:MAG TPA: sigma-70 family RNA polymerase sigma factor, partial [Nitrososphaera sp.]|nr:sigma-70 family RNA polymerase sigma factor [Nitrososphaera sp.]